MEHDLIDETAEQRLLGLGLEQALPPDLGQPLADVTESGSEFWR